ncbi:ABC transporter permease subunit [Blastopirellula sp. JC732]|uniref:ABC transporter permease subunit n=1 Tax=Blastopirellula sediminis TaxID=2894196 RepID=A0A9X1SER7_9BACT|nr:ABC transporter permease [Blastopirellula sediminis]MCC9608165.1 ABC transporter permease subunit [Blastopirellula sediminis]MCC9627042.1 ABC transporter permease subunit [Blastopirellula sediminis]
MKYKIIRLLDIAGLNCFEPVVRLCYGDEPKQQVRKIGLFIVAPVAVFLLFIGTWAAIAPLIKTKAGRLPSPTDVVASLGDVYQFHWREYTKKADFARTGEDREQTLAMVTADLEKANERKKEVDAELTELTASLDAESAAELKKYETAVENQAIVYKAKLAEREQKLLEEGEKLDVSGEDARQQYVAAVRAHQAETTREADHIKELRSDLSAMRKQATPELAALQDEKNALDQETQFLTKRISLLSDGNRRWKVANAALDLKNADSALASAAPGERYDATLRYLGAEERILSNAGAIYAKPPTFFDQVFTSIECVFVGFLIATAIAIPIGVLCGLNRVIMASLTPLISLFKPVSPIVWLPIVFIVVGGFIERPDEAWVKPAFLSSAITVALCSLWPTLVNTALGVASIDKDHMNVARVLRLSFWDRLTKIVIPSALPLIFTGLRISLGVGWMVLIAAELLSSSPGLGKFVWDMFNNGSSDTFSQMLLTVFVVGIVGLLLDRIMIVFQRLVSFDGGATAI